MALHYGANVKASHRGKSRWILIFESVASEAMVKNVPAASGGRLRGVRRVGPDRISAQTPVPNQQTGHQGHPRSFALDQPPRFVPGEQPGCFRLEAFAGWDLHPVESAALSRRTSKADIAPTVRERGGCTSSQIAYRPRPAQQLRPLGEVRRHAPRLVRRGKLRRRANF